MRDHCMHDGADLPLDVGTALMIPTASALLADGCVGDDEVAQVRALCMQSPIFLDTSDDEDAETILTATRLVQHRGYETMCRHAARVLSPKLRETAFAFAVSVIAADGYIHGKEESLIAELIDWLSLDLVRAQSILSVIPILQYGLGA